MTKKFFYIPVTWKMYGALAVEAESLEDAMSKFDPVGDDLPEDRQFVDGSYRLTSSDAEEVRGTASGPFTFRVELRAENYEWAVVQDDAMGNPVSMTVNSDWSQRDADQEAARLTRLYQTDFE